MFFLSWITPIIALLIKIESSGPVFFKQTRNGIKYKEFTCYKFRSMNVGAEQKKEALSTDNIMNGPVFKMINDPRITKLGKFLRKTSLDELPQLLNVLRGDMSLVGPRPALPKEIKNYQNWHRKRHSVKPGITGLWQISGRSELSFEEMCLLDLYYIENHSIFLDFEIMFETIPAMIVGKGAY